MEKQITHPIISFSKGIAAIIGIGISLFHLYTGGFGVVEAYMQRSIHLMSLMTLAYLTFPTHKKWSPERNAIIDIPLAMVCLLIGVYLLIQHDRIVGREWYYGPITKADITFGIILMLLTLEAARRVVGLTLPIIASVFIVYCLFGTYFPYPFTIKSPPPLIFIDHMFMTPQAIFGVPTGVSATFVFLFILFGAFLEKTGGGQFIIDFSMSIVGRATGGPAKVAIVASTLFGTVSGHSVANVYGTGTFTIPLMKRMGYKPAFAGAVEAAASAGGQIMPPIMGAAAFIMAEILGVPYLTICAAAILPAPCRRLQPARPASERVGMSDFTIAAQAVMPAAFFGRNQQTGEVLHLLDPASSQEAQRFHAAQPDVTADHVLVLGVARATPAVG